MSFEKAEVIERYPDHHFRTEIPNIIYELDLDVYERDVYCILKRIAGDYGECWRSKKSLSQMCGIGETKLKEVIKKLSQPFEILENKPLIEVIKRKNPDGSDQSSLIIIAPIWDINGKYFRKLYKKEDMSKKCLEGSRGDDYRGRVATGEGSPETPKEEPLLIRSHLEEQTEPIVVFQEEEKKELLFEYNLLDQTIRLLMPFHLEQIKDALEAYEQWSEKNGDPSSHDAMILTLVRKGAKKNNNEKDLKIKFLSSIKHLDGKVINNVNISVGIDNIYFHNACAIKEFKFDDKDFIENVEKYIEELNKNAKRKG